MKKKYIYVINLLCFICGIILWIISINVGIKDVDVETKTSDNFSFSGIDVRGNIKTKGLFKLEYALVKIEVISHSGSRITSEKHEVKSTYVYFHETYDKNKTSSFPERAEITVMEARFNNKPTLIIGIVMVSVSTAAALYFYLKKRFKIVRVEQQN